MHKCRELRGRFCRSSNRRPFSQWPPPARNGKYRDEKRPVHGLEAQDNYQPLAIGFVALHAVFPFASPDVPLRLAVDLACAKRRPGILKTDLLSGQLLLKMASIADFTVL